MTQPFSPERYTLVLKNGQLLRHQDLFTLVQFRSDVRLASFWPETAWGAEELRSSPAQIE